MLDTSGFKSTERKEQELVQYKGQMRIVGVLKEDNTTIGYLIMVEKTYQLKPFSVEQTKELLKRFKFVNANLVDNTIENTECSMNRLLVLNSKLVPIDNIGIYIIGRIKTPQKEDSFRILDTTGKVLDVTSQELLKQLSYNPDCKLINAKQVTKQDKAYISAIKGEFTTIEKSGKKSSSTSDSTNTQEENLKQQRKQANIHRHLVNLYNSYLRIILLRDEDELNAILRFEKPLFTSTKSDFLFVNSVEVVKLTYNNTLQQIKTTDGLGKSNIYTINSMKYAADDFEKLYKLLMHHFPDKSEQLTAVYNTYKDKVNSYNKELQSKVNTSFRRMNRQLAKKVEFINIANLKLVYDTQFNTEKIQKIKGVSRPILTTVQQKVDASKISQSPLMTGKFTSAKDMAELGFAVTESNKNYAYKTITGRQLHLKYLGDVIPNYDDYFSKANCLGDVLVVSHMEAILKYIKDFKERRVRIYGDKIDESQLNPFEFGSNNYNKIEDCLDRLETMLAIQSIYRPDLTKIFMETHPVETTGMLPGLDLDESISYDLKQDISIYYKSGFTCYYKNKKSYSNYSRGSIKYEYDNMTYFNFRTIQDRAGLYGAIKHSDIQDELASIVNMITSERCTVKYIGKLIAS